MYRLSGCGGREETLVQLKCRLCRRHSSPEPYPIASASSHHYWMQQLGYTAERDVQRHLQVVEASTSSGDRSSWRISFFREWYEISSEAVSTKVVQLDLQMDTFCVAFSIFNLAFYRLKLPGRLVWECATRYLKECPTLPTSSLFTVTWPPETACTYVIKGDTYLQSNVLF